MISHNVGFRDPPFKIDPQPAPPACRRSFSRRRRGTTIIELVISTMLLGAVLTIALPALSWVLRERRATHRQQDAIQEVHNVLERITVRPWDDLSQDSLADIQPSDAIQRQLPRAALEVLVAEDPQSEDTRRVTVTLGWQQQPDRPQTTVSATAWVYRTGGRP